MSAHAAVSPQVVSAADVRPSHPEARATLLPARLLLFAGVSAAACVASAPGGLRGTAIIPVALGAVAVAMWHGAYDHVLAEQTVRPALGPRWLPRFLAGYAALAAVTLLGWFLFPVPSLVLFLLYSAWHFGTEPEQFAPRPLPSATALLLGAAPIVAACRWHPGAVAPIFAAMLRGQAHASVPLTHALGAACYPVLVAAALGIAAGWLGRGRAERAGLLGLLALDIALFAICDPLTAFAVFFCCWHTPEHLLATSLPGPGETLPRRVAANLLAGLLPWALSVGLLGLAFAFGRRDALAWQGELFIALSALTVPHMALNEWRRARSSHPETLLTGDPA